MAIKTQKELNAMTNENLITYLDSLSLSDFKNKVPAEIKVRYFIAKFGVYFAREAKGSGLFLSAIIPMSMYESFYGRSNIFMNANNFGGVGYNKNIHDDFYQSTTGKWAKWKNYEEGIKGYVDNLKSTRYKVAREKATSPEQQIKLIHESGYDPLTKTDYYVSQVKGNVSRVRKLLGFGRIN